MTDIISKITEFVTQVQSATGAMTGIYAALVALALIGLLFSRFGGK